MYTHINLFGLHIPLYGLCMMIGVILSGVLIVKKALKVWIKAEDSIIVLAVALGTSLIGAGFLYIIVTYTPKQIVDYIKAYDFSFLVNGGLVFYGGLMGGLLGAYICVKVLNIPLEKFQKCAVPYIPLGHSVGRIGCLMAGCCYGLEYSGVFAVKNMLVAAEKTYFPIQIIEMLFDLVITGCLILYARKSNPKHSILVVYLFLYSFVRFFIEFCRGDKIRGEFLYFSTSQWISILIIFCCIMIEIIQMVRKGRKTSKELEKAPSSC